MGFIRNRITRRFGFLGLLSDLALVGTTASRLMQRRTAGPAAKMSATEMALAGGAAMRLLQRLRRRRKQRRTVTVIEE